MVVAARLANSSGETVWMKVGGRHHTVQADHQNAPRIVAVMACPTVAQRVRLPDGLANGVGSAAMTVRRTVVGKRCPTTLQNSIDFRVSVRAPSGTASIRRCVSAASHSRRRVSGSVKYAWGFAPFNLQFSISDARHAQFSPPSSGPGP